MRISKRASHWGARCRQHSCTWTHRYAAPRALTAAAWRSQSRVAGHNQLSTDPPLPADSQGSATPQDGDWNSPGTSMVHPGTTSASVPPNRTTIPGAPRTMLQGEPAQFASAGDQSPPTPYAQTDKTSPAPEQQQTAMSSGPQSTLSDPASEGASIRMDHPTCINTSRERHWALLQELVPRDQWQQTAVVLACLESIYRAEYLASGQAAVAALQAANAAPVHVAGDPDSGKRRKQRQYVTNNGTGRSSPSPCQPSPPGGVAAPSTVANGDATPIEGSKNVHSEPETPRGTLAVRAAEAMAAVTAAAETVVAEAGGKAAEVAPMMTAMAEAAVASARKNGSSNAPGPGMQSASIAEQAAEAMAAVTAAAEAAVAEAGDKAAEAAPVVTAMAEAAVATAGAMAAEVGEVVAALGSEELQEPHPESLEAIAARLDAELAALLTLLVQRSHFQPLTRREVEVAKTLNRDYLSQLFIVGDLRRMDRGLVKTVSRVTPLVTHRGGTPLHMQPAAARNMHASPGSFDWCIGPLPSASSSASSPSSLATSSITLTSISSASSSDDEAQEYLDDASLTSSDTGSQGVRRSDRRGDSSDSRTGTSGSRSRRSASPIMALLGLEQEENRQLEHGVLRRARGSHARRSGGIAWGEAVPGAHHLATESEGLLLLKRCWAVEKTTGRLVVQKLDFLQTLVVTNVLAQIRRGLALGAAVAQSYLLTKVEEMQAHYTSVTQQEQQQKQQQERQQQQREHQQQQSEQEHSLQEEPGMRAGLPSSVQEMLFGSRQVSKQSELEQESQQDVLPHASARHGMVSDEQQDHRVQIEQQHRLQEAQADSPERSMGGSIDRRSVSWTQAGSPEPNIEGSPRPKADRLSSMDSSVDRGSSMEGSISRRDAEDDERVRSSGGGAEGQGASSAGRGGDRATPWSQRMANAGRSWAVWLSERGVGPRLDVLTLDDIDATMPIVEPPRLRPLRLRKVALGEVMGHAPWRDGLGSFLGVLFQPVNLQEPSFKEFAVVYRRLADASREQPPLIRTLVRAGRRLRLLAQPPPQPPKPRPPIQIRIYRDLALPMWQLALPDKLLQFRPLDLLRVDLFALTGLVALLAQAKYESILLDVITIVSASVFLVRIALGFKRMDDRYRSQVAEVLRDKTIASDGTALEYLAAAAGLQQFKQVSLAYIYALHRASLEQGSGMEAPAKDVNSVLHTPAQATDAKSIWPSVPTAGEATQGGLTGPSAGFSTGVGLQEVSTAIEQLLWNSCKLQVRFDAEEAVSELVRLGLASELSWDPVTGNDAHPHTPSGASIDGLATVQSLDGSLDGQRRYQVVGVRAAMRLVQQHWDGLLWQRVDGILREFE